MKFTIASGSLTASGEQFVTGASNTLALVSGGSFDQGTYSLAMKAGSVGDNGMVFGVSANGASQFWETGASYYFFFISQSGGAYLGKVNNGSWTALSYSDIAGYDVAATHDLKVIYYNVSSTYNVIDAYVDGTEYSFYRDYDSLTGTSYGIRAGSVGTTYEAISITSDTGVMEQNIAGYTIVNGKFEEGTDGAITSDSGNSIILKKDGVMAYGELDVQMASAAAGDNGLVFGLTANGLQSFWESGVSYYFFFISKAGTAYLGKVNDGVWTACAISAISGFDQTQTYALKVMRDEASITCFVNGTLLVNYSDALPLTGTSYGFRAGVAGVRFTDLSVVSGGDFQFTDPTGFSSKAGEFKEFDGIIKSTQEKSLSLYDETLSDGTVSSYMVSGSNTNNGLVFRLSSSSSSGYYEKEVGLSYYFFHISTNNTARLLKFDGTSATILKEMKLSAGYTSGTQEYLSVVFSGSDIKCYLGEALYLEYTDASPLTGTGLGIRASGLGVVFHDFACSSSTAKKTADLVLFGHSHCEMWGNVKADLSSLGTVANLGIGGTVTGDWKNQATEIASYDPKYVLCWLGSNDVGAGVSDDTIVANITALLGQIQSLAPDAQIYLFTEFYQIGAGRETADFRAKIDALDALYKSSFASTVSLIDVHDVVLDASGNVDTSLFRDVYHLTDAAYTAKVAPKVLAAVNSHADVPDYNYPVGDEYCWSITTDASGVKTYTSQSTTQLLMFNKETFDGGTVEYDLKVTSDTYTYLVSNGIVIGATSRNVNHSVGQYYVVGRSPWADFVTYSKNEGAFNWEDSNKIAGAFPTLNTTYHLKFIWDKAAGAIHYFVNGAYAGSSILKTKISGSDIGLYADMPGVTFSNITFSSDMSGIPSSILYTSGTASSWTISGTGEATTYTALAGGNILMFATPTTATTFEYDLNVTSDANTYWIGTGLVVGADSPYDNHNYGKFVVVGRDDWGGFNTFSKDNGGFAWNDSNKIAGAFPNLNTVYHIKFVLDKMANTIAYYVNDVLTSTQTPSVAISGNYWGLSADSAAVYSNIKLS